MKRATSSRLAWMVIILLLAAASRAMSVHNTHLIQDEARSVLRSFGTFSQIIAWQPLDWPPLYNLLLGGWQTLIDPHPVILRLLSVLLFLPGATLSYRLARRMYRSELAAWGTMIAYCALGYSVFLSTFLRGYVITVALFPALLLATIRYFDHPSVRRASILAGIIAMMYYTTYTSAFAFIITGVYSLIVYGRALWRWWLPVIISAALALPDVLQKLDFLRQRVEDTQSLTSFLPPVPEAIAHIYWQYAGQAALIWLGLFVMAAVLLLLRQRNRQTGWLFAWVIVAPFTVYGLVAASLMFIFTPRYGWWGLLAIALVIGAGLAYLPRRLWTLNAALMLVVMFVPLPLDTYRGEKHIPYEETLSWLHDHALPGDVLVIDPNYCIFDCGQGDAWVYYADYYLHDAVKIVNDPGDYPRVWYLKMDGREDPEMRAKVETGRLGSEFVGPWDMLFRLYEAPPDPVGVLFANGLRFHGFQVVDENNNVLLPPYDVRELATTRLRLWWSVDHPVTNEYSISAVIYRGHSTRDMIAQKDGPPQLVHLTPNDPHPLPQSMLDWKPGQLYVEVRGIDLPELPTWYEATLYLIVYQWWDGVRISAPGVTGQTMLPLDTLLVMGW